MTLAAACFRSCSSQYQSSTPGLLPRPAAHCGQMFAWQPSSSHLAQRCGLSLVDFLQIAHLSFLALRVVGLVLGLRPVNPNPWLCFSAMSLALFCRLVLSASSSNTLRISSKRTCPTILQNFKSSSSPPGYHLQTARHACRLCKKLINTQQMKVVKAVAYCGSTALHKEAV